MKVSKVKSCWCMEDCNHHGEGFVIKYNDDETIVYMCEKHFNELAKSVNDMSAELWLEEEMRDTE